MILGTVGKYERLSVLGRGVSGIVYLARDTLLNKQVALKEVDVEAGDLSRFLEEARVMDRLRHPNIVRVNGVDRMDSKVVIDMEYVRGRNLQETLRAEGRLPVGRALSIAVQTLDALDYAHGMQTVHRDIKPANILLSQDGAVKLVDFGLAEILATNAYAGGAGTYAYMAPEDFSEEDRSDSQSDIWAVGVTLYEMLTGQRPFKVENLKSPFAWKRALETQTPIPLVDHRPDLPSGLQPILDRALTRDKALRYGKAGEFRDDLISAGAIGIGYNSTVDDVGRTDAAFPLHRTLRPSATAYNSASPAPTYAPAAQVVGSAQRAAALSNETAPFDHDAPTIARKRNFLRLSRRGDAHLTVEPDLIDFGTIRWGESRSLPLRARVRNGDGAAEGTVVCASGWLSAHPAVFRQDKQTVIVTAQTDQIAGTGEFESWVRVDTKAGTTSIPARLQVVKPRPTFLQIAAWFAPLYMITLFPALAVAISLSIGLYHDSQTIVPQLILPAVTSSMLLSLMLLLIGRSADIGIGERIACGGSMATMCVVIGVCLAAIRHGNQDLEAGLPWAMLVGFVLGGLVSIQLLSGRRWIFWGAILAVTGLLCGAFLMWLARQ